MCFFFSVNFGEYTNKFSDCSGCLVITWNRCDNKWLWISCINLNIARFFNDYNGICRPVIAVIDIEILEVQEKKKKALLDNVIRQQGPPDGTVIVSVANGDFDDDMVDSVVETFSDIGEIILVRWVVLLDNVMWQQEQTDGSIIVSAANGDVDAAAASYLAADDHVSWYP